MPPTASPHVRSGPYYLCNFDRLIAPVVASWARDAHELFWLAPNTPPPLTANKVIAWAGPNASPLLLARENLPEPLGYIELNAMPAHAGCFWMGHCVIHPERRGCGLGRLMVHMMLSEAFLHRQADRVSLIVFPENVAAIRTYRHAGFTDASEQIKYFQTTGRHHRMMRMSIDRKQHERFCRNLSSS